MWNRIKIKFKKKKVTPLQFIIDKNESENLVPLVQIYIRNLFWPQAHCRTSFPFFWSYFWRGVWQGPGGCQKWAECSEEAWVPSSWKVAGDRWQVKESVGKAEEAGVARRITFVKCQGTENDFPPGDSACSGLGRGNENSWGCEFLNGFFFLCHCSKEETSTMKSNRNCKDRQRVSPTPVLSTKTSAEIRQT